MACVPSLLTPSELSALSLLTSAWRYEGWLHAYPLNRATVLDYFKHSPFYELQANNERINAASQQQQQQQQQQATATASTSSSAAAPSSSSFSSSFAALRHMEGLEFALDALAAADTSNSASPASSASSASASTSSSYFVIRKQWRISPSVVQLMAVYYVVAPVEPSASTSTSVTQQPSSSPSLPAGSVIPMPSFHALAQCALDSSAATLTAAIAALGRLHSRRQAAQPQRSIHQQQLSQHQPWDADRDSEEDKEADEEGEGEGAGDGEDEDTEDGPAAASGEGEGSRRHSGFATSAAAALVGAVAGGRSEEEDDDNSRGTRSGTVARPLYAQMAADAVRMMSIR